MGLFDRFKTRKVKLPVRKFDLKLPNGMAIGDYLLLNSDESQREFYRAEYNEKFTPVFDNTDPLHAGEILYEAEIEYYSSQIKGWSFKRACNARNVEDFVRSTPYLHNDLDIAIGKSDALIRSQNEYQRLLKNRDTIKEYDIRIYTKKPKKHHLDAYGEHNHGDYLLVYPFYSYRYNIVTRYFKLQMELDKYREKERSESENEAHNENLALSHYAYLIAGWSFSKDDSQENKYKFLKNNPEIMDLLYEETLSKERNSHKFTIDTF